MTKVPEIVFWYLSTSGLRDADITRIQVLYLQLFCLVCTATRASVHITKAQCTTTGSPSFELAKSDRHPSSTKTSSTAAPASGTADDAGASD